MEMVSDLALSDWGWLNMIAPGRACGGLSADRWSDASRHERLLATFVIPHLRYAQHMRRVLAIVFVSAVAIVATGCGSSPSRQEVAERYEIELEAAFPGAMDHLVDADKMIDQAVDDAFDGMCGEDAFRAELEPVGEFSLRPWDATCLMYFEEDMSAAQVERAKASILR